jgi:HEAT repeat protein
MAGIVTSGEVEADRIRVFLGKEGKQGVAPSITYAEDGQNTVEIRFLSIRPCEPFYLPYAVAVAQDYYNNTGQPTGWAGADAKFLTAIFTSCLRWSKGPDYIFQYWNSFRHGRGKGGKRCEITKKGETVARQRGRAAALFQVDKRNLFLGDRIWQKDRYLFQPIEFQPPSDPQLLEVREFVESYFRCAIPSAPSPADQAVTAAAPHARTRTGRTLVAVSMPDALEDHCSGLKIRLDRLAIFSEDLSGCRGTLYLPRTLLTRQTAEDLTHSAQPSDGMEPQLQQKDQFWLSRTLDSPSCRLCLVGDAGSGKSTLLEQEAWCCADHFLAATDKGQCRVPFLASLERWTPSFKTIASFVADQNHGISEEMLTNLCRTGRALLLLDGLDEVQGGEENLRAAETWLEGQMTSADMETTPILVAGRPEAFDWSLLRSLRGATMRLQRLTREEIKTYVRRYFDSRPTLVHQVMSQLDRDPCLIDLLRNPLLLMLLCYGVEEGPVVMPHTEWALLDRGLVELLKRRGFPVHSSLRVLEHLAWECWQGKVGFLSERKCIELICELPDQAAWNDVGAEQILNQLCEKSGILVRQESRIRFAEVTYIEVLAGRWLASQEDAVMCAHFSQSLWDSGWSRVLLSSLGHAWVENSAFAYRIVRWLLAEADAGRDDVSGTLAMFAARAVALNASACGAEWKRVLHVVAIRAVEAWRFAGVQQTSDEDRQAAHMVLSGVLALGDKDAIGKLLEFTLRSAQGEAGVSVLRLLGAQGREALRDVAFGATSSAARQGSIDALAEMCPEELRDVLAPLLTDPDDKVRRAAFASWPETEWTDERIVKAAVRILQTGRCEERYAAAEALGVAHCIAAEDALIHSLETQDSCLRCEAMIALARLGSARSMVAVREFLAAACTPEEEELAVMVIGAMGEDDSENLIEDIVQALDHPLEDVRSEAFDSIKNSNDPLVQTAIEKLFREGKDDCLKHKAAVWLARRSLSAPAIEWLGRLSSDDDELGRIKAVRELADTRRKEVAPYLLMAMEEWWAWGALSFGMVPILGAEKGVGQLLELLESGGEKAARNAALMLGNLGHPGIEVFVISDEAGLGEVLGKAWRAVRANGIVALERAARQDGCDVRCAAAWALGNIGTSRAAAALGRALATSHDAETRLAILEALDKTDGQIPVDLPRQLLEDKDRLISWRAAKALGRIRSIPSVEAIVAAARRSHKDRWVALADALGETGRCEGGAALIWMLQSTNSSQNEDWQVRCAAARALGQLGFRDAAGELAGVVANARENAQVRCQAALALKAIAPPETAITLSKALKAVLGRHPSASGRDTEAEIGEAIAGALGAIGTHECIDPLISALKASHIRVRIAAAQALGQIGSERGVRQLIECLGDSGRLNADDLMERLGYELTEALVRIGSDDAVAYLVNAASEDCLGLREHVCRSLSLVKPVWAISFLLRAANEEDTWAGKCLDMILREHQLAAFWSGRICVRSDLRLESGLLP